MPFRRRSICVAALALLVVALAAWSLPVTAAGTPAAVDPAECTVEPLTIEQLTALVESARPVDAPWKDPLPTAKAADAKTLSAITAVIRESVACTNANDPMRNFALFSDRYLIERFTSDSGDDLGHLAAALTRHPGPAAPKDRLELVSVQDAVFLDAQTVVATVTTQNAESAFVDRVRFIRAADGDGWLIDAIQLGAAGDGTPAATPSS